VGKPEGKRPPGRQRHRWQDNIKIDLRERGWGGMGWTHLAQDRDLWRALVNTVMNVNLFEVSSIISLLDDDGDYCDIKLQYNF
jgi:hypothetical protein